MWYDLNMFGYDDWKLATPPEYDEAYFGLGPQDDPGAEKEEPEGETPEEDP